MRKQEALRLLDVKVDAAPLTAAQLRKQYLRAALATHPDKNQADEDAGSRFSQLKEAYDLLLRDAHDAESAGRESQRTSTLLVVLQRALAGEDVEEELRRLGVHRPPAMFGVDLAVPFDQRCGGPDAGQKQPRRPEDIRQAFAEAFHDAGLDEEGNPLEGWARPPVIDEEDLF